MKIGTKSVLYGAHCFFIHPWFVFAAWWKLYGFPFDPRLWVAFFVHDLGYWGKPNMDGKEGETHVVWGARVMLRLFDKKRKDGTPEDLTWYEFCLLHSRYYAKQLEKQPSKLCYADKLAICLEPAWFYLFRVNLSGEIKEYMALAKTRTKQGEPVTKYESMRLNGDSQFAWFYSMTEYLRRWVAVHKDGAKDTWTPSETREVINENGVWK